MLQHCHHVYNRHAYMAFLHCRNEQENHWTDALFSEFSDMRLCASAPSILTPSVSLSAVSKESHGQVNPKIFCLISNIMCIFFFFCNVLILVFNQLSNTTPCPLSIFLEGPQNSFITVPTFPIWQDDYVPHMKVSNVQAIQV